MPPRFDEQGRSMIEMLGVLAVIGILTVVALVGYQKAIQKSRVNKTIEKTAMVMQRYADLTLKNIEGLGFSGERAVYDASTIGMADSCDVVESEIEDSYYVCDVPLGEMYMKLTDMSDGKYSYMLFVTLVDDDIEACIPFLTQPWNEILPKEWWSNAMIWLKSDSNTATVYPQGGGVVQAGEIASACNKVCVEGEEYCTIIFDLGSVY